MFFSFAIICLLFAVIGCDKVKWVKLEDGAADYEFDEGGVKEEAGNIAEKLFRGISGKTEEEPSTIASKEDRVDVTLGVDSAEVSGVLGGITRRFSTPYDDKDAIIFDIAREWNKKVADVRALVYFNGRPYSIKAIKQAEEEVSRGQEKNAESFNLSSIPFIKEFDSGVVRGIGCDFNKGLLRLRLANEFNEDLAMYRNVLPRIKNALVVYFNNKVVELHCVDSIASGEIIDCIKGNIVFAASKQGSVVDENAEFEVIDVLAVFRPGMNAQFPFRCLPQS